MDTTIINNHIDVEQIKLIIFDCDGVLIDSEWICIDVLMNALAQYGVVIDKPYFYTHFLGRHFEQIITCAKQDFGVDLPSNFENIYQTLLLNTFEQKLLPCTGIGDILKQVNIAKCIATSSYPERTQRALAITELTDFFGHNIFTASEVKHGKPAPDLFLHAAKRMNIAPEHCLVIEDSAAGLLAAKKAGMMVWHYKGGTHFQGDVPFIYPENMESVITFKQWSDFYLMAPTLITKINEVR